MKKRLGLVLLATAVTLTLPLRAAHAAADWDDDDDAARTAKPAAHVRNYPGGTDEQDLKVQPSIPASGRYPDSVAHPEKARAVDDDGNPIDD